MKQIEFNNMNVQLLEWDAFDRAFAVRLSVFEALWPLSHGQQREVVEEFNPLSETGVTWTRGTLIEVDRVFGPDSVSIRSFCRLKTFKMGMILTAWKYDVLSKTRPV